MPAADSAGFRAHSIQHFKTPNVALGAYAPSSIEDIRGGWKFSKCAGVKYYFW